METENNLILSLSFSSLYFLAKWSKHVRSTPFFWGGVGVQNSEPCDRAVLPSKLSQGQAVCCSGDTPPRPNVWSLLWQLTQQLEVTKSQ